MSQLAVIVPCYNEEGCLPILVERLRAALERARVDAEIILVDDGSTDRTRALLEEMATRSPVLRPVFHERNRGIGAAWRSGLSAARSEFVAITDADLQYAPEDLPRLFHVLLREGVDVVHGWRVPEPSQSRYRALLSAGFSLLLNAALGTRLRDAKSGFLCARREVFADMLATRHCYRCLQHFIVANAVRKGYRIRQEPVAFGRRQAGRSFIRSPLRFALRSLLDLPAAVWEFRVLRGRSRRCAE